jgi:hypothetical protein
MSDYYMEKQQGKWCSEKIAIIDKKTGGKKKSRSMYLSRRILEKI